MGISSHRIVSNTGSPPSPECRLALSGLKCLPRSGARLHPSRRGPWRGRTGPTRSMAGPDGSGGPVPRRGGGALIWSVPVRCGRIQAPRRRRRLEIRRIEIRRIEIRPMEIRRGGRVVCGVYPGARRRPRGRAFGSDCHIASNRDARFASHPDPRADDVRHELSVPPFPRTVRCPRYPA